MTVLFALTALLTAPADPVPPIPHLKVDRCSPSAGTASGRRLGGARKLAEEPDAVNLYAMYHLDPDGCAQPIAAQPGPPRPLKLLRRTPGGPQRIW